LTKEAWRVDIDAYARSDGRRGHRPGADQRDAEAQFRIVLRPLASSLPLGRRGRARSSLEGSFAHQVQQAEQEPGVRRQL
jgi:hypothetical protein